LGALFARGNQISYHSLEMEANYGKKAVELAEAGRITLPDFGLDPTYFFDP
jgi:hypothetical protein